MARDNWSWAELTLNRQQNDLKSKNRDDNRYYLWIRSKSKDIINVSSIVKREKNSGSNIAENIIEIDIYFLLISSIVDDLRQKHKASQNDAPKLIVIEME